MRRRKCETAILPGSNFCEALLFLVMQEVLRVMDVDKAYVHNNTLNTEGIEVPTGGNKVEVVPSRSELGRTRENATHSQMDAEQHDGLDLTCCDFTVWETT